MPLNGPREIRPLHPPRHDNRTWTALHSYTMHAMVFALQHNNTKYKQEEKVNTIEKTITLPIHAATASLNVFPRLSLALPSKPFTTTLLALAGIDAQ